MLASVAAYTLHYHFKLSKNKGLACGSRMSPNIYTAIITGLYLFVYFNLGSFSLPVPLAESRLVGFNVL